MFDSVEDDLSKEGSALPFKITACAPCICIISLATQDFCSCTVCFDIGLDILPYHILPSFVYWLANLLFAWQLFGGLPVGLKREQG